MNKPLVSIIIPVYNAALFIDETINSALQQTWPNKEIILVDDGSTDNSLAIIKGYESASVKVFSQENKGAAAARNKGLAEASGDYIQFLDGDDLLSPDKIENQLYCLNESETHLSICKTAHFTDGENYLTAKPSDSWFDADNDNPVDFLTKLYAGKEVLPGYGGMITIHSWLTPRALIDQAGLWNETLSIDDDGEFFCRVTLASQGILFSKQGVCYYRKFNHGQSLSAQKSLQALKSSIAAIELKHDHLKAKSTGKLVDQVFAKHYWWTGVIAFPQFKSLSKHCIQKAKLLGYSGERYVGGPTGHIMANFFGWKTVRFIAYYQHLLKKYERYS